MPQPTPDPSVPSLSPKQYALTTADKTRFKSESQLGIIAPDTPMLSQVSAPVPLSKIGTAVVQSLIERLFATAQGQRSSKHAQKRKGRGMVGLAAPQLGVPLRIILVDTQVSASRKTFGRLECFINPHIVWRTRETVEGREGCFSTGPVWGMVRRPAAIKIAAYTPSGAMIERIFEGFTARIVQHEIDHLDGIRFPERIKSDKKRHWVHTEELELYTKQSKGWPRVCTLDRWRRFIKLVQ